MFMFLKPEFSLKCSYFESLEDIEINMMTVLKSTFSQLLPSVILSSTRRVLVS